MTPNDRTTDLDGRTAVVTGGSSGIGRAIAEELAAAGACVVLTSRDQTRAEQTAAEVARSTGGEVMGLPCDVRVPASCRSLMAAAVDRFHTLDILVNNAGIGIFKPFQDMTEQEWRAQVETNLHGVFHCSRAALPYLREAGRGGEGDAWIVNIGSLASRNSFGRGAGYNASKFGLLGMTEAMMIDLRYEGIRTSMVMPGSVDTAFREGEAREWALRPEDVARAVIHLLSFPRAALVSRVEMRPTRPPRS